MSPFAVHIGFTGNATCSIIESQNSVMEGEMARKKKKSLPNSEVVRVGYGIFGHPDKRRIQKAIDRHMADGYRLVSREDEKSGCTGQGFTDLTFVLEQKDEAS